MSQKKNYRDSFLTRFCILRFQPGSFMSKNQISKDNSRFISLQRQGYLIPLVIDYLVKRIVQFNKSKKGIQKKCSEFFANKFLVYIVY